MESKFEEIRKSIGQALQIIEDFDSGLKNQIEVEVAIKIIDDQFNRFAAEYALIGKDLLEIKKQFEKFKKLVWSKGIQLN